MLRNPVDFSLVGEPQARQVEAAARRRIRFLEGSYPAIRSWQVTSAEIASDATQAARNARVGVVTESGERVEAGASAVDTLGALRAAFDELESILSHRGRRRIPRAPRWLSAILPQPGSAAG